jgi:hypothetical protein
MPAVSKAQQKFMGMVHATQKGDMESPSPEVSKAADSMSDKDAKDFASTSHKGLPDKIKEMVLAELRSVKSIQTDYTKVIDAMEKHLEAYKKSKGTPAEKEHIQQLKTLTAQKKKLADELNAKVSDMYKDAELKVDEMNTTGGVEGYNTPFAFSGKDSEEKKGKRQADLTGYSVVKEGKYYVSYNRGRGQGKDLEKEFDPKTFKTTGKPKVFNSYSDAKKYAEKMEKMFRNSIGGSTAYWVSDEKMNRVEESVNEEKVYIDFLNKKKGFKQDRIKFNSYEDAVKWARKNFEKFNPDMIKFESMNEATKVHFKKELKNGNIFQVVDRDTTGMRGTQDKFKMQIVDKRGKVVKDLGSHPSINGAEKFGNKYESMNEAIQNAPAKNGKELADFILRHYDFYTDYIDDGGQRRRAIKSNEGTVEWFDSHPIDLKKEALKILQSKIGSSGKSQIQRVFGKSTMDK